MLKLPSLRSCYDTYVRDISIVFLLLLPLTICNAISLFSGHFLNFAEQGELAKRFFYFSDLLIGVYPIALCIITTYYLSSKHNVSPLIVIPYALVMFTGISIANDLVAPHNGLPNNPLIGLLAAGVASAWCVTFKVYPLDPSRIDFVSALYKQSLHFFGFLLLTVFFNQLTGTIILESDLFRQDLALNPLTISGGLVYQFILGLLGSIGINGHNFLFRAKQQLFEDTKNNLEAWEMGEEPLNILGQGFYDAFLAIGGSGSTLSLLLCILFFSKDKRHLTLALSALPLVMFNINELLLFGLPIIFNPTLIVPFVLVPMISFVVVYSSMSLGLVNPVSAIVDWMTPPLISGYLATQNSIGGVVLQVVVIAIGVLVYRPFYLHYAGKSTVDAKIMIRRHSIEKSSLKSFLGDVSQSMGGHVNHHEISQRVGKMMTRGSFTMYYQPQVNLKDPNDIAYESLVRYRTEDGHILPPLFIKDFHQLGAIKHLDEMVIDLVLRDLKKLPLNQGCRVGINISAESVSDPDIVDYISERLYFYGVPPSLLELEITEEAILEDHVQIRQNIEILQGLGVKVAIDDFGAGYASFPHLLKFNFDKVKLDRSLLLNATEERGQNLYQLLAKISEVTGCALVAEGIETEQDMEFVESCGINICQGFYFAKPMALDDAIDWAASASASASASKQTLNV
ncbi:EAL domain-containing protein [Enterovibrio sp. ZSDZ35]|uniref:EAL domain-containing protein n=1 Tax=Enterovibrio qingdaonensis TaxID=2899818 RepID=A0ABT5QFT3_9GAMM|nr:EAL domain-containing protein [Enterovibrio sp. ZSDZ35]MDD1779841.1 EAL domain-containing protein [Enterovibrio sp. ZSDZ35]